MDRSLAVVEWAALLPLIRQHTNGKADCYITVRWWWWFSTSSRLWFSAFHPWKLLPQVIIGIETPVHHQSSHWHRMISEASHCFTIFIPRKSMEILQNSSSGPGMCSFGIVNLHIDCLKPCITFFWHRSNRFCISDRDSISVPLFLYESSSSLWSYPALLRLSSNSSANDPELSSVLAEWMGAWFFLPKTI